MKILKNKKTFYIYHSITFTILPDCKFTWVNENAFFNDKKVEAHKITNLQAIIVIIYGFHS